MKDMILILDAILDKFIWKRNRAMEGYEDYTKWSEDKSLSESQRKWYKDNISYWRSRQSHFDEALRDITEVIRKYNDGELISKEENDE